MTCPHCYRKDEEIRYLQRELGIRRQDGEIGGVMIRLGVSPTEARLLMAMYRANGKAVGREALETCMGEGTQYSTLTVNICNIRKAIGKEAIATAERMGYGLTPMGWSLVHGALRPPEMQEPRGT